MDWIQCRIMIYKVHVRENGQSIMGFEGDTTYLIPQDPANTDYQAYLAWVAEGNTAEEWSSDAPQYCVGCAIVD